MDIEPRYPIKIVELELSQPLPEITAVDEASQEVYQQALLLVRLHSIPIGIVNMDFIAGYISAVNLAVECWALLGDQINHHLCEDGLNLWTHLPTGGLTSDRLPKCMTKRKEILNSAPFASVVISTRERVHSLANTMSSILALEYPQFEVILVDNAPKTSATYDYYSDNRARFLRRNIDLRYVREDIPGLAVAHNRGLEAVRSQYVAFTDDDVIVDKHWLAELMRGFEAAPGTGCVTGLVVPLELDTPAQVLFEEFGGFTKGFVPQIFDLAAHHPEDPLFPYAAGRFGTGANMAFRTEFLLEGGGFEPALGIGTPTLGGDDMEAFYENLLRGHALVYQPSALVHHQHRKTYADLQRQMFGYGVGLTAFLTRCILDRPKMILDLAPRMPAGVKYAMAANSGKNMHKSKAYPKELEWIERKGMLFGPAAYVYSRWKYRQLRKYSKRPKPTNDLPLSQQFIVHG